MVMLGLWVVLLLIWFGLAVELVGFVSLFVCLSGYLFVVCLFVLV